MNPPRYAQRGAVMMLFVWQFCAALSAVADDRLVGTWILDAGKEEIPTVELRISGTTIAVFHDGIEIVRSRLRIVSVKENILRLIQSDHVWKDGKPSPNTSDDPFADLNRDQDYLLIELMPNDGLRLSSCDSTWLPRAKIPPAVYTKKGQK